MSREFTPKRLPVTRPDRVTRWRVPGTPRDIPAGSSVVVVESIKFPSHTVAADAGRRSFGSRNRVQGSVRHRVLFGGHSYWVDDEALEDA